MRYKLYLLKEVVDKTMWNIYEDEPSIQVNVKIPRRIHDTLHAYCKQHGLTKSQVLRQGLKLRIPDIDK